MLKRQGPAHLDTVAAVFLECDACLDVGGAQGGAQPDSLRVLVAKAPAIQDIPGTSQWRCPRPLSLQVLPGSGGAGSEGVCPKPPYEAAVRKSQSGTGKSEASTLLE